jgi:hypothetical protein
MHRVVVRMCCLLLLARVAHAQATWDFANGTGAPLALASNLSGGTISAANATIGFNATSASSGYAGATGGNNAVVSCASGSLSTATSTFFTFTLTAATNHVLHATGLTLGARGTATGPTTLTLLSSADNFTAAIASVTVAANSAWALVTLTGFSVQTAPGGSLTFRLYGSGGSGGTSNWRIDDVSLTVTAVPPPSISVQPSTQTITSGATASFSVSATGTGTLGFQWRKDGNDLSGATSPTLNLGTVTTANAGSYEVVVTDTTYGHSTTSAAATLTVNPIATTLAFSNLSATYDGATHAAAVAPSPSGGVTTSLSYTATAGTTYGPSSTAPTHAGTYAVTASLTDSEHVLAGASTATLTIAPATASVSLSNLTPTYDGAAHPATVTTTPSSLSASVTYAGSSVAPVNAGSYAIVATLNDPDYTGAASGTLIIAPAVQAITFNALADRVTSDPPFAVSATASSGLSPTFSLVAGSPTIATISGATLTLVGGTATGTVTVRASQAGNANTLAAPDVDRSFTVALPAVTINTQPGAQTVIAFQDALFSVSASGGSGTLTYQWRKDGAAITGNASAATATLTLPRVTSIDAGRYDVVLTAPGGSATSFPAVLTVQRATATVTLGRLSATYDGAAHPATATTSPASLAVSFTYDGSNSAPTAGGTYAVAGTITDANYAGSATGTLVIGPASQTITFPAPAGPLRATVPFTVSATASSGLTPITFSILHGSATATGTDGATITAADTDPVVVRATQAGNGNYAAASADLTLAVGAAPAAPSFAVQPAAAAGYFVDDTVTLSATANGVPDPVYQWRKDGAALAGNSSATTATLVLSSVALPAAGRYDLVVTNPSGTATSHAVTIAVAKRPQTITFTGPTTALSAGTGVPLVATASSGLPVSFTIVSGAASIAGTTLTSLGSSVVVRAYQAGNSTTYDAAPSVDRTFTFVVGGSAPFIFNPPLDQTVARGATVSFSAAAIGTPTPTWQWQKDGVAIEGATGATLTLASVSLSDAARYTAVAINGAGRASASAVLTVIAPPAFSSSPASQSVAAGGAVTLAATATGSPAPALQWRKNGTAIPGAITGTLALSHLQPADAATYDVVATNSLGSATSGVATLVVVTRDFSGTYFGAFAGAEGDFALYVRSDRTGVFLGYLPGLKTGLVTTSLVVDLTGHFSLSFAPITAASGTPSRPFDVHPTAAAASSTTLSGDLDEKTGTLTAAAPELSLTLAGARAPGAGTANAEAGYYSGALVGSADARSYVIVGADGQAFVLTVSRTASDGAGGRLGANGHLTLTTASQSTLDLGFTNGAVSGTVTSPAGVTTLLTGATDGLAGSERLANLSARGGVAPGAPLIAGFVVTGATPKQVLIRAAGPALAAAPFNLTGALADPALQLWQGSTVVAENDNWSTSSVSAAAITTAAAGAGAFPFREGSLDAALLTTLAPGAYSVQVAAGATSVASPGIALVEIYEILATGEAPGTRRLANLSTRGPVAPGGPLIAGFVITGTAPQRVLIRGIGPGLGGFGVPDALADPALTLFHGSTALKTNDDWFRDADAALMRDAAAKTGAFALAAGGVDAAMLLYLDPGAYTAQVSSSGLTTGTGTALVEIYEVSP